MAEYESTLSSVTDLADPTPAKKCQLRDAYTHYSNKDRAKIGQYALENSNDQARHHFLVQFPDLKESSVRDFKKA